ncbi:MAG: glycine cleavage T C-terminal barrel domain-containing protein, partial [Burkholderiaceae bacterium]
EMGRRAWGAELGPDETPYDAAMMFAVKLDKPTPFIGQQALRELQGKPLRKKLITLVLDSADIYLWGGESIIVDGASVGEISSAGWSPRAGACVALGYVRGDAANAPHAGTAAQVGLWGENVAVKMHDRWLAKG